MKKLLKVGTVVSSVLLTGAVMATEPSGVQAAATQFETDFGGNAAIVGGAIIAMAFLAIGYKWVKGMIFS
ncbi:hypothetical protein IDAT_01050 [Pseudidiomarina atlantica]|uniref:Major coat protein n=1 Tax=Pseudidiomarina atlantica TaxID=1517416 RepID=A0A094JAW4_9GAMM|nr:hypothetical protein [Pseudidiomarina atlantica]KFZ29721.1 hypothetical protein IDAT_01050 [Pseudidiomarina atlantica]